MQLSCQESSSYVAAGMISLKRMKDFLCHVTSVQCVCARTHTRACVCCIRRFSFCTPRLAAGRSHILPELERAVFPLWDVYQQICATLCVFVQWKRGVDAVFAQDSSAVRKTWLTLDACQSNWWDVYPASKLWLSYWSVCVSENFHVVSHPRGSSVYYLLTLPVIYSDNRCSFFFYFQTFLLSCNWPAK